MSTGNYPASIELIISIYFVRKFDEKNELFVLGIDPNKKLTTDMVFVSKIRKKIKMTVFNLRLGSQNERGAIKLWLFAATSN